MSFIRPESPIRSAGRPGAPRAGGRSALLAGIAGLAILELGAAPAHAVFERETIEERVGAWGKAVVDVDADGLPDLVVAGGELGGSVYWYRAPDWERFRIGVEGGGDDVATHDMNGDGALDVVVNRSPIAWYENPRGQGGDPTLAWTRHDIDPSDRSHDVLVHDFDGDERPDVSVRSAGGTTRIYFQESDGSFLPVVLGASLEAEGGHAHADVDHDGRLDIVGPGYWLRHPTSPRTGSAWTRHAIDPSWPAGGAVGTADFDGDGRLDVVLAPSETGPGTMTWYEAPEAPLVGTWIAHPILVCEDVHRIRIVDLDQDGDPDVAFAEMHQSQGDRVGVLHNGDGGLAWSLELLSTRASHNVAVGDVDADGDVDLLGANWDIDDAPDGARLNLWRNRRDFSGRVDLDEWTPILIDDAKPDRAFGLAFGDLDGDDRTDVATGRGWYRNPGAPFADDWPRVDFGIDVDAMLLLDIDGDQRLDVIAQGPSDGRDVPIVWLAPIDDEATAFAPTTVGSIPADPADGRSQGYAAGPLLRVEGREIVFSSQGIFAFTIPTNPTTDAWIRTTITEEAREEALAIADVDGDDDLDVVGIVAPGGGTTIAWWENERVQAWTAVLIPEPGALASSGAALLTVGLVSRLRARRPRLPADPRGGCPPFSAASASARESRSRAGAHRSRRR